MNLSLIEPPLAAIGEEYGRKMGDATTAKKLADAAGVPWLNIGISIEERQASGIYEDQRRRPMSTKIVYYRVPTHDIREEEWVRRLLGVERGTVIVVCGYLHCAALVEKLRSRNYAVDERIYLKSVSEIRMLGNDGLPSQTGDE